MQDCFSLLASLIQYQSISPDDAHCQDYLITLLEQMGFTCHRLDKAPVSNFYASIGSGSPRLVFAGHTDVVPPGDKEAWHGNPFQLQEKNGLLYGRGVADMKGSIACMITMATKFLQKNSDFKGTLGFIITSGEEGNDYDKGTPYIMEYLQKQGELPDYCIVGEPSSSKQVGDVIKVGRRGSLSGKLQVTGLQGHVAYPHLADNAIHKISPVLAELAAYQWDQGNAYFPPTTFQITSIQSGGLASNIIPGTLSLDFNIRYSTEQTPESLQKVLTDCLAKYQVEATVEWRLSGLPFLTEKGSLLDACVNAIHEVTGLTTKLSTSGGTSDGRFIAPYGVEVIEVGLVNATIHQVNEHIVKQDLVVLETVYERICENLLIDCQGG